jgi:hypothetical protein
MICHNHAYPKLFPFIVTHPNSHLSLLSPCIYDRHVVKLHLPILEPIVRYNAKLQPHPDLA